MTSISGTQQATIGTTRVVEKQSQSRGTFCYRMEARDGRMGFDFEGTYTKMVSQKLIEYMLGDNRGVSITFEPVNGGVKVIETFEADDANSAELQRQGWQSILNRFASYVESKK